MTTSTVGRTIASSSRTWPTDHADERAEGLLESPDASKRHTSGSARRGWCSWATKTWPLTRQWAQVSAVEGRAGVRDARSRTRVDASRLGGSQALESGVLGNPYAPFGEGRTQKDRFMAPRRPATLPGGHLRGPGRHRGEQGGRGAVACRHGTALEPNEDAGDAHLASSSITTRYREYETTASVICGPIDSLIRMVATAQSVLHA